MNIHNIIETMPEESSNDYGKVPGTNKLIVSTKEYVIYSYVETNMRHESSFIVLTKKRDASLKIYKNIIKQCDEIFERVMSKHNVTKMAKKNNGVGLEAVNKKNALVDGIYQLRVTRIYFTIQNKRKKQEYDVAVHYEDSKSQNISVYVYQDNELIQKNDPIIQDIKNAVIAINDALTVGCMHACSNLHRTGLWFVSSELYNDIFCYIESSGKKVTNIEIEKKLQDVVKKEISNTLETEFSINSDGGLKSGFPAATVMFANQGNKESAFFPQLTSDGWTLATVTNENNIDDTLANELRIFNLGINLAFDIAKKVCGYE